MTMQITQTKNEDLTREFTVTMTAEEIDQRVNDRLTELGKTVKMPGFRPGKIPMNLLKSKYGKAVMGEVLEHAVNDSTLKAINENSLRPAMRPKIEVKTFDEKQGLEYTMAIEVLPEIKIADFTQISLEKLTAKPSKKEITEALERIAKANKTTEKVEENRPAKTGDVVVINFDGTVDGQPFPGMKGDDFPLELGSKSFIEGFEEQLVGAKVGDHKVVKVTFPKDYAHDKLQGVAAEFKVDVKELRTSTLPAIDDEFAKKLGFESLAKIEEVIEKQIQDDYDQLARMNVKRALLDKLDETHDFAVPQGMVDAEFQGIWQQLKGGHEHNHGDEGHVHGPDCNHGDEGTPEEREEYQGIAERRVKLGLVLAEIGRVNKVEVTNQELQQAVINEARKYPGKERQVFEYYQQNPQALDAVKAPIYEDKVVDFILERSNISARQVDIEELTKASESEPPKKAKSKSKAK
ncbi:MAG TPA: trigger factor [Patescibacteria group bacterium]|nr:trigger factor [Patescibacteria group bacterium]